MHLGNVLVTDDLHVVLCDFGGSYLKPDPRYLYNIGPPLPYICPDNYYGRTNKRVSVSQLFYLLESRRGMFRILMCLIYRFLMDASGTSAAHNSRPDPVPIDLDVFELIMSNMRSEPHPKEVFKTFEENSSKMRSMSQDTTCSSYN
jgi:hypothetical protein